MSRMFAIKESFETFILILLGFKNNSKCENMFSLVRYSSFEEFSQKIGTMSRVASMKTGSGSTCEDDFIEPLAEFIDDLQISRLIVGHTYVYCIMAENDGGAYMPNPYDTTEDAIDLREIKNIKLANQMLKIRRKKKQEREKEHRKEQERIRNRGKQIVFQPSINSNSTCWRWKIWI